MAFAFEDALTGENKVDPRYSQVQMLWYQKSDSTESIVKPLGFHKCDDSDFSRFYAPGRQYKSKVAEHWPNMYCLNQHEVFGLQIHGDWWSSEYGYLEVNLIPCQAENQSRETINVGPQEDTKVTQVECIPDKAAQEEFLDGSRIIMMLNHGRFDQEKYYAESIQKESVLMTQQFDQRRPNWVDLAIKSTSLFDLVDYIQYG